VLTLTERTTYPEGIENMMGELTSVIEDFDRAVMVQTLSLVKEAGKHSLPRSGDSSFSKFSHVEQVQQALRLRQPVKTSHDLKLLCMQVTRESILNQTIAWATNILGLNVSQRS
jgi:hypothetical protein